MLKSLVVLAIFSTMSAPAAAQAAPTTNQAQPAKPQTVKKRVCEMVDEDSYSRLGNRKICRTIEVKAEQPAGGSQNGQQTAAPSNTDGNNL